MFDFIKTSNGAYYLTLSIAVIVWFFGGIGVFAGYHLNRVRGIESKAKAISAEADADAIRSEAADLRSKLVATSKELEETKAKTLTHDDILSYRTITTEKRKSFLKATKDLPKGRLFVSVVDNDTEAYQYALAINALLFDAGYEPTKQLSTIHSFSGPITEITAGIESKDAMPALAEPLIKAMLSIGVPVQPIILEQSARRGPEFLVITIGSKAR